MNENDALIVDGHMICSTDVYSLSEEAVWRLAAEYNCWLYVSAFGGYICHDHLDRDGHYVSEVSAEDACFLDGLETIQQARDLIAKAFGAGPYIRGGRE